MTQHLLALLRAQRLPFAAQQRRDGLAVLASIVSAVIG